MKALEVITLVGKIAAESNIAVGIVFALIQGVRNAWPKGPETELITDEVLIATMKSIFAANRTENLALQAEIEALLPPTTTGG